MRIYLVGFMCSGKSTVGRLLSSCLDVPFYDVDEEIVKRERMSIPEIFEKRGEEYFREIEFSVLRELSENENFVISTGGGLGANERAMEFMKEKGKVIYINVNFETFLERCGKDPNRPLLKRPLSEIKELFKKRKKVYEKAHIKVEGEKAPEEVVNEILSALEGDTFRR
ncbi:shikimate kinase [Aquifex pyrophilus]